MGFCRLKWDCDYEVCQVLRAAESRGQSREQDFAYHLGTHKVSGSGGFRV